MPYLIRTKCMNVYHLLFSIMLLAVYGIISDDATISSSNPNCLKHTLSLIGSIMEFAIKVDHCLTSSIT